MTVADDKMSIAGVRQGAPTGLIHCRPWANIKSSFSYSITTHKGGFDGVEATRFGWNYTNSLIGIPLLQSEKGSLPDKSSFCQIDKPNVNLLVVKQAEDRNGYILRLQEIEGKKGFVKVTFPHFENVKAYLDNLVEDDIQILKTQGNTVMVPVQSFGITTVRIVA